MECIIQISCTTKERGDAHLKSKSVRADSTGADCAGLGASFAAVASEADFEPNRLRKKSMALVAGDRADKLLGGRDLIGSFKNRGRPTV